MCTDGAYARRWSTQLKLNPNPDQPQAEFMYGIMMVLQVQVGTRGAWGAENRSLVRTGVEMGMLREAVRDEGSGGRRGRTKRRVN